MQIRVALFAPLQPVSLPRFSLPSPFSLSLSRPFLPPPRCLVREFSWLAELTAFGKIASSTHRSYQRGLLSLTRRYPPLLLRVRHLPRSFPFSPSLLRIACTTRTRIHTHTQLRLQPVGFDNALSASGGGEDRRGPRRVFRSSSQFRVHTWRGDARRSPLPCLSCQFAAAAESRGRKRRRGGGREREREAYVGSGECCAWIEVSVPWSKRIIQTPPPSASTLLFLFRDSLPCLPLLPLGSASIYPSLVVVRARPACLSRSPLAALRDIWIVGSHLPHYHTNRLARSLGHSLHPVP